MLEEYIETHLPLLKSFRKQSVDLLKELPSNNSSEWSLEKLQDGDLQKRALGALSRLAEECMKRGGFKEGAFRTFENAEAQERDETVLSQLRYWNVIRNICITQNDLTAENSQKIIDGHIHRDFHPKIEKPKDKVFEAFLEDFNELYLRDGAQIFAGNLTAGFTDLKKKYEEYLEYDIELSSACLIHYLVASCPQTIRVHSALKAFQTILDIDYSGLRQAKLELVKEVEKTQKDLSTIIRDNSHPNISRKFYEILNQELRFSGSLDSAREFLKSHGMEFLERDDIDIIEGGIPPIYPEMVQESTGLDSNDLCLPDYMTSNGHSAVPNAHSNSGEDEYNQYGNDNWILWLNRLHKLKGNSPNEHEASLFAYLISDYHSLDKIYESGFDKLYNILRVKFASFIVLLEQ